MLKTMRAKGLSDTALKEIALALMVLDHIHYFFAFTGAVPEWFSMLGRGERARCFCSVQRRALPTPTAARPTCSASGPGGRDGSGPVFDRDRAGKAGRRLFTP